jgi:hypothetical protein
MNKKTINLTEYDLKNIIKESVNNIIKESFNDKEISYAIEEHGGIKKNQYFNASIFADYDLQKSQYKGYLSRNTVNELDNADLLFNLRKHLIFTNDGGAIVVDKASSYNNKSYWDDISNWENKVRTRNKKWGENEPNNERYKRNGEDKFIRPNEFNTVDRRLQRKG